MRRPLPKELKKVSLNLSTDRAVKEMAIEVADSKGVSISELFTAFIEKEHAKLVKAGKTNPAIKGQVNLEDVISAQSNAHKKGK